MSWNVVFLCEVLFCVNDRISLFRIILASVTRIFFRILLQYLELDVSWESLSYINCIVSSWLVSWFNSKDVFLPCSWLLLYSRNWLFSCHMLSRLVIRSKIVCKMRRAANESRKIFPPRYKSHAIRRRAAHWKLQAQTNSAEISNLYARRRARLWSLCDCAWRMNTIDGLSVFLIYSFYSSNTLPFICRARDKAKMKKNKKTLLVHFSSIRLLPYKSEKYSLHGAHYFTALDSFSFLALTV